VSRPLRRTEPWLGLRNGVYQAFWYNGVLRRVERQSLRVRDPIAADIAFAAWQQTRKPLTEMVPETEVRDEQWGWWARKMCKRARENAKAKGRVFDLSPDFVARMMARQEHCCAVSGIPFSAARSFRNPFAPSIDQITPGGGYAAENVRVVSVIVNTAMNGWGEKPLLRLIFESRFSRHETRHASESDNNTAAEKQQK
jgi:hypothetical protein